MSNNFPKDLTVHLKAFEGNLCGSCNNSEKAHVRLACGHLGCVGCVASEVCQICSELMDPSSSGPRYGDTFSERAKHRSELTSNQDTSQLAVYQKQKISEQLRIEKELFPECIQAPAKYFNKRKSLNVSKRGKENRHNILPGELTSSSFELTMNKSRNFVQEWLNKQPDPQTRSPFTALKVNTHHNIPAHSTPLKRKQKENANTTATRQSNRKRSRLKQTTTVSPVSLENYLKPLEKREKNAWSAKRLKQEFDDTDKHVGCKGVCEESGIVIDDDCFTIEDTQDQTVDKDRMALLEVQKASLNEMSKSVMVIGDTEDNHFVNEASTSITHDDKKVFHVPFYKKGKLYENCMQCLASKETLSNSKPYIPDNAPKVSKDVSVTVENKSFFATISIVDCTPINSGKKQSAAVQTELQEPFVGFEQPTLREAGSLIAKMRKYIETQDVDSESQVPDTESQKTFSESISKMQDGSDKAVENVEQEENIKAGHSSEHEFGVLSALDGAGFQNRQRRAPRGATPDSNNSSDKENFDPNRRRKGDIKKKKRKYK